MSEYIYLVGSEQVQNAANTMRLAAEEMVRASRNMDAALERHQRFLEDWLTRFEASFPDPATQAANRLIIEQMNREQK